LENAGWKEWRAMVAHNIRAHGSGPTLSAKQEPPVPERRAQPRVHLDNTCTQLIRLSEALGSDDILRTGSQPETAQPRFQRTPPLRTESRVSDGPRDVENSKAADDGAHDQIKNMPRKEGFRTYLIAFGLVLTATVLGYCAILAQGSVPMGLFVIAVIIAAGRGIMPGLLATALGLLVMLTLFRGHISVSSATQSMSALFLMIGIVTNFVFYKLNDRTAALAQAKAELEATNQQLREKCGSLAEASSRLAEQKAALFKAHEDLRFLSKRLTDDMQVPLRRISVTTEKLVRANAVRLDASFSEASGELIKGEVRRVDSMMAELAARI
jgi:K+-sensing histidine kinase KdpD